MPADRDISLHSNGESHITHTFVSMYFFNKVLSTDFIQILNKSKNFDLLILYLHVVAILYCFFKISQFLL